MSANATQVLQLILGLGSMQSAAGALVRDHRPFFGFLAVCICMNERVRKRANLT